MAVCDPAAQAFALRPGGACHRRPRKAGPVGHLGLLRLLELLPELVRVGIELLLDPLLGACQRLVELFLEPRLADHDDRALAIVERLAEVLEIAPSDIVASTADTVASPRRARRVAAAALGRTRAASPSSARRPARSPAVSWTARAPDRCADRRRRRARRAVAGHGREHGPTASRAPSVTRLRQAAQRVTNARASHGHPQTTKRPTESGVREYRYGDSNPGFRRERAAS